MSTIDLRLRPRPAATAPISSPVGASRSWLDWTRLALGTASRVVLYSLLGLMVYAAAPAALGWSPTTVMTGSMEPRIHPGDVVVHDAHRADPSYAFALSRLSSQDLRYTPMGVFRSVQKPTYDRMMAEQLHQAAAEAPSDLDALLAGSDTWTVTAAPQ